MRSPRCRRHRLLRRPEAHQRRHLSKATFYEPRRWLRNRRSTEAHLRRRRPRAWAGMRDQSPLERCESWPRRRSHTWLPPPAHAASTQPVFQSPFVAPGAAASSGAQAEAPATTVAIQAPQLFVLGSTAPQTTFLEHRESMSDDAWHESASEAADDASSVSRHSRRQQFAERQRLAQAARETKKISTFFRPSADPDASRRAVADAHQAAIEAGAAASAT